MAVIEHNFTDLPVCPWCGHEHRDVGDFYDESSHHCHECGKPFRCEARAEYIYSTTKEDEEDE